jgi:hypothetical protein
MQIKTIFSTFDNVDEFDQQVNDHLAEGWQLVKRDVLPETAQTFRQLYAELVKPDAPAAPQPRSIGPLDAAYALKEFCKSVSNHDCLNDRCPLSGWCDMMRRGDSPSEWEDDA